MPSTKKKKTRAEGAAVGSGSGSGSGSGTTRRQDRAILQNATTVIWGDNGIRVVSPEDGVILGAPAPAPAPAPARPCDQPSCEATQQSLEQLEKLREEARTAASDDAADRPADAAEDCAKRLAEHVLLYTRRPIPHGGWAQLASLATPVAHELFDEMVHSLKVVSELWGAVGDEQSDLRSAHWAMRGASRSLTFEENVALFDERVRGLEMKVWLTCGWQLLKWLFEDELIVDGRMVEMLIFFRARSWLVQAGICSQEEAVQPIDLFAVSQMAWLGLAGPGGDYKNVNLGRILACTDAGCHTVLWAYTNGWQFETTGCGTVHEWLERLKVYFSRQALPTHSRSPGGRPTNAIIDLVYQVKPGGGALMWRSIDATVLAECLEREDVIEVARRTFGTKTPLPLGRASNVPQIQQACAALLDVLVTPMVAAWFDVNVFWRSRYAGLIAQLSNPPGACCDRLYAAARSREEARWTKNTLSKKQWGVDWKRTIAIEPVVHNSVDLLHAAPTYWLFSIQNAGTSFTAGVHELFKRFHPDLNNTDFVRQCDRRLCLSGPTTPNITLLQFSSLGSNAHLPYESRRVVAGLVARPPWRTGPERFSLDYARADLADPWDGIGDKPRVNVRITRRTHPAPEVNATDMERWHAGQKMQLATALTKQDQVVQLLLRGVVGLEHAVAKPSTSTLEWNVAHPEQSPLFRAILGAMRHSFLLRFWDPDFPRDDKPSRFVALATRHQSNEQILVVLAVAHKLRAVRAIKNPYKRPVLREMEINARIGAFDAAKVVARYAWTVRQPLWRCAGCGRLEPPSYRDGFKPSDHAWSHNEWYTCSLGGRPGSDIAGEDRQRVLSFECGGDAHPVTCPKDCDCIRCVWLRIRDLPNEARYHNAACRRLGTQPAAAMADWTAAGSAEQD